MQRNDVLNTRLWYRWWWRKFWSNIRGQDKLETMNERHFVQRRNETIYCFLISHRSDPIEKLWLIQIWTNLFSDWLTHNATLCRFYSFQAFIPKKNKIHFVVTLKFVKNWLQFAAKRVYLAILSSRNTTPIAISLQAVYRLTWTTVGIQKTDYQSRTLDKLRILHPDTSIYRNTDGTPTRPSRSEWIAIIECDFIKTPITFITAKMRVRFDRVWRLACLHDTTSYTG